MMEVTRETGFGNTYSLFLQNIRKRSLNGQIDTKMAVCAHPITEDKYWTRSQETYTKSVCKSFRIPLPLMVYELRCKRGINDTSQVRKYHL